MDSGPEIIRAITGPDNSFSRETKAFRVRNVLRISWAKLGGGSDNISKPSSSNGSSTGSRVLQLDDIRRSPIGKSI
jgi:hypothetical protein